MSGYRRVLADRTARALFTSAAVSGLGDWIGLAGLVVLAYERSGSTVGPAALFAVQGLAAISGTGLLGPHLDRFDRARMLRVVYCLGAAALLLPVVLGGTWPVLAAAALVGLTRPVAAALRHALAGAELDDATLGPVVALQKATGDAASALGLATGGILTVTLGPSLSLGLDAVTFLAAALLTLGLPVSRGAAPGQRAALAGYLLWLRDPVLRPFVLVLVGLGLVAALPEAVAPAAAGGSAWLPAVLAAQATGTALGSLVLGHRSALEGRGPLLLGMVATALALGVGALAASEPGALAAANLLLGFAISIGVLAQTGFTRSAPRARLGAAVSSAITVVMLAEGLGALALGTLAAHTSVGTAYLVAAVPVLLVALSLWRPRRSGPADPPPPSRALPAGAPAGHGGRSPSAPA